MTDDEDRANVDQLLARLTSVNDRIASSNDAIARSNDQIEASNARIADLADANRRSRRTVHFLALSLVVDVLLSLGLGVATHIALDAADTNRQILKATCAASNESRLKVIAVWENLIGLTPPPSTPEAKATVDKFLAFVRDTYQQKAC